jgi:hypothetical protein
MWEHRLISILRKKSCYEWKFNNIILRISLFKKKNTVRNGEV